ncbi:MAG: hypothetical protein WCJ56_00460 [bacterium]
MKDTTLEEQYRALAYLAELLEEARLRDPEGMDEWSKMTAISNFDALLKRKDEIVALQKKKGGLNIFFDFPAPKQGTFQNKNGVIDPDYLNKLIRFLVQHDLDGYMKMSHTLVKGSIDDLLKRKEAAGALQKKHGDGNIGSSATDNRETIPIADNAD